MELKLPMEFAISANPFSDTASVNKFILAPNAPDPLVEVPTPLCIWRLEIEEVKSGRFTQ